MHIVGIENQHELPSWDSQQERAGPIGLANALHPPDAATVEVEAFGEAQHRWAPHNDALRQRG